MKKYIILALIAIVIIAGAISACLYIPDHAANDAVSIEGYRHLDFSVPSYQEMTQEEKEAALEEALIADGIYKEITNRKVKKGDIVNIAFDGYIDKVKIEDLSELDYNLEIGAKTFISGFEEGLVGKKPGKKCTLKLRFPLSYPNESYAGHDVTFRVTIRYIREKYTADTLTDGAVTDFTEYKTAKEYIQAAYDDAGKKHMDLWKAQANAKLWDLLIKEADYKEIDQDVLDEAYLSFDGTYEEYASQLGISPAQYRKDYLHMSRKAFEKLRKKTCVYEAKKQMLVTLLAKQERIKGDSDEEILEKLEEKLLNSYTK